MSNVIDLTVREPKVIWFIDIGEKEFFGCQYREEGMTRICREPHWSVVVNAPTVDRLCVMLKKAEKQLAKEKAIRSAMIRGGSRKQRKAVE